MKERDSEEVRKVIRRFADRSPFKSEQGYISGLCEGISHGIIYADNNPRSDLFDKETVIKVICEYFPKAVFDKDDFKKYLDQVIKQREFSKCEGTAETAEGEEGTI